ncbi:dihydrofolate reductase family protein [Colwelliaceae bacterium 6441]
MKKVPDKLEGKVFLVKGNVKSINNELKAKGYINLYINGGLTIQSFLKEDLVDQLIITTIPILLGSGIRLFGELDHVLEFRCTKSERYSNGICQNHFERYSG